MSYVISKDDNGNMFLLSCTESSFNELQSILTKVTHIGNGAFKGGNLEQIVIPGNIKSLGEEAFAHCHNLHRVILGDGVVNILNNCFQDCVSLEEIIIPAVVTTLNYGTFKGCKRLTKVMIPKTLKEIKPCAFSECDSLQSIKLPSNTNYADAFKGNNHSVVIHKVNYTEKRLIEKMISDYTNKNTNCWDKEFYNDAVQLLNKKLEQTEHYEVVAGIDTTKI